MIADIKGLEEARGPDRLYPIRSDCYRDLYAGRIADGRQILAGEWCPDVVVGLFDDRGNLQQTEYRTIISQGEIEERLRDWYGYTPCVVRVKRFCIPPGPLQARFPPQWAAVGEPRLAIAPFPDYWAECYDAGNHFPTDDPDSVESIRGWIERGNFVLYWGNELHLDSTGEVVGS